MNSSDLDLFGGESKSLDPIFYLARAYFVSVGSHAILNIQTLGDEKGINKFEKRS